MRQPQGTHKFLSVVSDATPAAARGNLRWVICALLLLATTVNYIDRQVIAVLATTLKGTFSWSETDYANIVFSFSAAYALGFMGAGYVLDRIGERVGLGLAVGLWSLAAMSHGLIGRLTVDNPLYHSRLVLAMGGMSVAAFSLARFVLGLAESANFPASIRTVAEWFPRSQRALATGVFNAGSNVGPIVTPLVVPWITLRWGWPAAFYATGSLGLLWITAWIILYRRPEQHRGITAGELALIRADGWEETQSKVPWRSLLDKRQVWSFAIAKLLTDPIWWFYLFWVPSFLKKSHGVDLSQLGPPLIAIYLMADIGSVGGGWFSSRLIRAGWSVNAARKTAMLVCALCVLPVFWASGAASLWLATGLIALAAAAHQGFSANLFTLVSDTVPRRAISSVVGIGGMAGAIGGMIFQKITGWHLDRSGSNYLMLFGIASIAYLVALGVIHLLNPRLKAMEEKVQGEKEREERPV